VAAGDRLVGQLGNQSLDLEFVRGITHTVVTRDGKGICALPTGEDKIAGSLQVKRRQRFASHIVAARQEAYVFCPQAVPKVVRFYKAAIISDEGQADGTTLAFDNCVGRKRSG
jgi:hypothetical protein